ncbi:hypothetical protein [Limibacillus halophilus]|uniref:Glucosyl transferase GtrII n=1 Tax=Limibacillus halophilus TaxID=1579333 RepID=A0A839T141_9PROT|nr:hypothetical protein [Limibacillus halophilus]MBB3066863.1 hypothetical protein [Limibacillus halophilus]
MAGPDDLTEKGAYVASQQIKLAAVFATFLVIFLRDPEILILGRFWAEEGVVYFSLVWNEGFWAQALLPFNGYYSLFVWLAVGLATLVPLDYAPLATGYATLLVMMTGPLLILYAPLSFELSSGRRALCAIFLTLPYVNTGVWLNSINAQFFFAMATALLLICDLSSRRFLMIAALLVLLAGLTGPVSVFLTPLFLVRAVISRERNWWFLALLLTLCAALQSWFMVTALLEGLRSTGGVELLGPRLAGFLLKLLLYPFMLDGARHVADAVEQGGLNTIIPHLLAGLALASFLLHLAWHSPRKTGLWLYAALLLGSALSFAGSLQVEAPSLEQIFHHKNGGRYFVMGNLLLAPLLLLPYRGPHTWLAQVRYPLTVLLLATVAYSYQTQKLQGAIWPDEVRQWRENSNYCLQIWPGNPQVGIHSWKMRLLPDQERGVRAVPYMDCMPQLQSN